jgi:hypothetical protein
MRTRLLCLSVAAALGFGVLGCTEKTGVQEQTKVTGPEGTTKVTRETKVESSGKNPPAAPSDTTTPRTP